MQFGGVDGVLTVLSRVDHVDGVLTVISTTLNCSRSVYLNHGARKQLLA